MKNRALVSLVLLTFVTAGAAFAPRVFAQSPTLDKLKFTAVGTTAYSVLAASNVISGAVVIPDTYDSKPVTQTGRDAFTNCKNITSVTIPASVTSIGQQAFSGCTGLNSVTLGGSNTSMSNTSFPGGGDLFAKYGAGGAGTYTRPAGGTVWTKQGSASAPAQTTPAQTAQGQAKYYLEIWNISAATYNTIDNSPNNMREDDYFLLRTASGTSLRDKGKDLTLEQVRQKLLSVAPQDTSLVNYVNNDFLPLVQQKWGGVGGRMRTGTYNYTVYFWIRRTE